MKKLCWVTPLWQRNRNSNNNDNSNGNSNGNRNGNRRRVHYTKAIGGCDVMM